MHWKAKAIAQQILALVPRPIGDAMYFRLQRRFGAFRALDRYAYFEAAGRIDSLARTGGGRVENAYVVEVGAGWDLAVALGLWLGGAKVLTVDMNRYLKPELYREVLAFIRDEPERLTQAMAELVRSEGYANRRDHLVHLLAGPDPLPVPSEIDYRAPADARRLDVADGVADLHVSRSVLEHVPAADILAILAEGRRVLRPGGLLVHGIDFSDHFAHSDPALPSVHFLRYSARDWERWSDNRFMFHNRLRVDDFEDLFRQAGLRPRVVGAKVDSGALATLRNGFPLDARFRDKAPETLATSEAWIVAEAA